MAEISTAIIGLGKWAENLAEAARRTCNLNLVACFSHSSKRAADFGERFTCKSAATLAEAISQSGVKAAIIASAAHQHVEQAIYCLEHGVNVFLEKPIALHLEDAIRISKVANQRGLTLMVGHEMRRMGSSRKIKQIIQENVLGRISMVEAVFCLPGDFSGDNWRCNRSTNRGGALMQLGIHHIDTLRYLLGHVIQVRGRFGNYGTPGDVDAVGIADLVFTNGIHASVFASYLSPLSYHLNIFGSAANLICMADMSAWPDTKQVDAGTVFHLQTRESNRVITVDPQDVLAIELEEFASCILESRAPETDGFEAIEALAIVEAALQSAQMKTSVVPRQTIE